MTVAKINVGLVVPCGDGSDEARATDGSQDTTGS